MRIYRGTVLDTPESPFTGGVLRAESDAGIVVADGVSVEQKEKTLVCAYASDASRIPATQPSVRSASRSASAT